MTFWYVWLLAGLGLLILEMLAPGAFLMWIGLAAVGTGLIILLSGIGFDGQVVTFAVLTALSLAVGLKLRRRRHEPLNTQRAGLVGRPATALSFSATEGRVRVGDSDWPARLAEGASVPEQGAPLRVEDVDGMVLIVRPE
ncbi:MAG TPA: NfeD family protein [Acetobacteraceae bacterium]|nr:NfeD family protein [Acetobacteraceae bacterium]